jgi:hypothetical protein
LQKSFKKIYIPTWNLLLPSISSEERNKAIKPPYLLQQEEQLSSYWDDIIDKYFDHPSDNILNNMIYPFYHHNYVIQKNQPTNGIYYIDKKIDL